MTNAERERAIQVLEYYGEKLGCKAEFDLAIKALKERPQDEWVLITERLPDYMEDTLVTIQVNNREPKVRSGFYAHGYFHNDNGDTWNWNDPEVKAWMPLPEAYKEAENEQTTN